VAERAMTFGIELGRLGKVGRCVGWWRSVGVSALASINVVNRHWAWLLLGWVTVRRQINHMGMYTCVHGGVA